MAEEVSLYNFYRRYLWSDTDFSSWQTSLIQHVRGMFEGLFQSAVMSGMEVTPGSALSVDVSSGLASGPSGYFHAPAASGNVALTAPTGVNPVKAIIVARPSLTNENYISRPTSPFDSVPLTVKQGTEFTAVYGTPAASPSYPSKGDNDVILMGVELDPGQSSVASGDLDSAVREIVGKNSFQELQPAVVISEKTAAYSPSANRERVLADAAGGTFAVTLPDATAIEGYEFTVKKVDSSANAVTVDTTASQTIDGETSLSLSEEFQFLTVVSDGANWNIISAG